jgi:hypothetical protein
MVGRITARGYNGSGEEIFTGGFSSSRMARNLTKSVPGLQALVIEQNGREVSHYLGSKHSERWVAVTYGTFHDWRRENANARKDS